MLKSSLCHYSDAYVLFKGTITLPVTSFTVSCTNNAGEKVIVKNCAPFTDCIREINTTRVVNT